MMDGGFILQCIVPACANSCNGCLAGEMIPYSICWVTDLVLLFIIAGVVLIVACGLMAWLKHEY